MQVSVRMLRYYDEIGLLTPAKTDTFTNHRFYSAEQIPVLQRILFLRDLGFNVSEIAVALDHWDNANIADLLEKRRQQIESVIQVEQSKLARIEIAKKDLQNEKMDIHYNVSIKSIPGYHVLFLRQTIADYYAEGLLWHDMAELAKANNISFPDQAFTIYHDLEYKEKDVDIELCSVVSPSEAVGSKSAPFRHIQAVPIMAATMVHGDYSNIAAAFRSLADWLGEHPAYEMAGPSRQIIHRGAWNESDPNHYLIEIQVPLEEKNQQG